MKKILLCTDGSAFAQVGYEYAAWWANRMEMSIEVLYVTDLRKQQAVQSYDFSGSLGIDSYQGLLAQLVELEHEAAKVNHERAKIILQVAYQVLVDKGVDPLALKLTHETGFLVDRFHDLEQRADLVMLGKRGETASFAAEHLGANMDRIVRSSHKPCLVTSRDFHPIDRLLFAYDGGKSCQKALHFLTNTPVFKGLDTHVVTVTKQKKDGEAIALLQAAESVLAPHGIRATYEVLHGNAEEVVVDYAETNQMHFLVMGAYGHSRIRHLVIGSTTAQVLRRSHLPVLLFR
ncbi:MAG: universal stress protein [Leptolyngbyaceae bacterium]|nr:universal stress protein [Leptolyngbyaceae bacterium]